MELFGRLGVWGRKKPRVRAVQREPSLVSASEFHLDPAPEEGSEITTRGENERSIDDSRFRLVAAEFSDDLGWPLKIDYWVRVPGMEPVTCNDVLLVYRRHELDLVYPHLIHGRGYPSNVWVDLEEASSVDRFSDLVVSVQMVDRRGPVTESELTRTNSLVYELAEKLNRKFQFDMTVEEAIDQAARLDRFCQQYDVLVIVNIAAQEGSEFAGSDIQRISERSGMQIGATGMFHFLDPWTGHNRFTMANCFEPRSFDPIALKTFSTRGLTLFMNIPRVPDPLVVFDEMIAVAQYTASELSGQLRDPDGGEIGELGVEKIRQQVTDIEQLFHRVGIIPGSEEALRLF
jgi:predicted nucleic acid-binding protein